MKSLVIAAGLATLLSSAALAQTATPAAPDAAAPATTAAPAATPMGATTAPAGAIVVLPPAAAGAAAAHFLTDDLEDEDVYGANDEDIGEIEDFVLNADGSVAAVVVEVGGFLGVGEKDVLVSWEALQITVDNNDLRVSAPTLTREALQSAAGVDVDSMVLGRD